ncbi:MAG: FecCD family ABC transporter permease, partial [Bacteroidota bacterium]
MNAELKTADNYTFLTRGIFLFIAVIILIIADLLTGSVGLSFNDVKNNLFAENNNSLAWISLHEFRIPRVITAIVSGIALSVSGLQMQTVFRNPLAGPYVLGISSGSGLGVALLVVGLPGLFEFSVLESENNMLLILASWLGAATVLILILIVSFRLKNVMSILILGIMLGSGISAIINILQYFSRESALKAFVIWTMGSLGGVSSNQIPYLLLGFLPGILLAILIIKPSNAMLLGENYARSLGVRILPYRIMV